MKPDGSNLRQLTDTKNDNYDNWSPSWSPDGKTIAFTRYSGGGDSEHPWDHTEIYTMRADGSHQKRLTNNSVADKDPAWSPDGTKIAFYSCRKSSCGLYVMARDGSDVSRITSGTVYSSAWSPDGTKIAFSTGSGLFVVNSDGSGDPSMLVSNDEVGNPTFGTGNADWSPDGQWIVFDADDGLGSWDRLYKVKSDGTGLAQLPAFYVDAYPVWSPDGTKIVFATRYWDDEGETAFTLNTMNPDGTGITEIGSGRARTGEALSWQPLP